MGKIKHYIKTLRRAEERTWVKCLLFVWSVVSIYDLLLSQFLPDEFSRKAPRAWEFAVKTGHMLPFWGWLLILAAIVIIALLEQIISAPKSLQVNAEISPDKNVYLNAYQVVHYLADESLWGQLKETEKLQDGMKKFVLLEAPIEFKERASEGRIMVYGASSKTGLHELIPETHWMSHGLDPSTIYIPNATSKTVPATYEASLYGTRTGYSDLRIVASDVYRTWPKQHLNSNIILNSSPLEIIFDPENPLNRFWSIEPMKDDNGKQVAGSYWEYRVLIKNKSIKTIRNVKVEVAAIGIRPATKDCLHRLSQGTRLTMQIRQGIAGRREAHGQGSNRQFSHAPG